MRVIFSDLSDDLWDEAYDYVKQNYLEENHLPYNDKSFDEDDYYDAIEAEAERLYTMYWEILTDELKPLFDHNKCVIVNGDLEDGDFVVDVDNDDDIEYISSWKDILSIIKHGKDNMIVYQTEDGLLVFEGIKQGMYPMRDFLFAVRVITDSGLRYFNREGYYYDTLLTIYESNKYSRTPNLGLEHP